MEENERSGKNGMKVTEGTRRKGKERKGKERELEWERTKKDGSREEKEREGAKRIETDRKRMGGGLEVNGSQRTGRGRNCDCTYSPKLGGEKEGSARTSSVGLALGRGQRGPVRMRKEDDEMR